MLSDINELIKLIEKHSNQGWIGSLDFIRIRYNDVLKSIPYNWYFCKGLSSNNINIDMQGNLMEADALLCNLNTLKGRLLACKKYSNIHINVEFDEIKREILNHINNSKISIEIAVAWLTDHEVITALSNKLQESVSIRVILDDDDINKESIRNFCRLNIPTKPIPPFGFCGNIMHNKFSIFDNDTVITGSYNWTNKACYNNENIVIVINQDVARNFLLQFNKLWNQKI